MIEFASFAYYMAAALCVSITSIGVGLGQGQASSAAITAINTQPGPRNDIVKTVIIGMALIETAALMGTVIAFFMLFGQQVPTSAPAGFAYLGIACALCLPGLAVGLTSSWPVQEACFAIARQPFFGQQVLRLMLITQSIIQTPIIFGFIIAMIILSQVGFVTTLPHGLALFASGLSIGIGTVGPIIGLSQFAKTACEGIGINRSAYGKIFSFTFVSEAIIETPIIFALVIAVLILFTASPDTTLLKGVAFICAGLCMGVGTIGPGVSSGRTASAACRQIADNPAVYSVVSKASMFGQGLIDTCAIYTLLVALLLITIS